MASELLEAARAVAQGFVFTIEEKAAAGDGRLDQKALEDMARRHARQAVIADFALLARRAEAPLNAVLLGALAASSVLPLSEGAFPAAIRAEGKAVDGNLRGFDAGKAQACTDGVPSPREGARQPPALSRAELDRLSAFAPEDRALIAEGIARLTDYQDAAYAQRYLARIDRFVGRANAGNGFIGELAPHLALRMSVEDVMRVAQLKLREERLARVARSVSAGHHRYNRIPEARPGGDLGPAAAPWALGAGAHTARSRLAASR